MQRIVYIADPYSLTSSDLAPELLFEIRPVDG